jgi:hypothetical protein
MSCFDLLMNASIAKAAYCAFDTPLTFNGQNNYIFGILLLLFMGMLFIQNRNIAFNFLVTLVLFSATFVFIPVLIRGFIILILILELAGAIWEIFIRDAQ